MKKGLLVLAAAVMMLAPTTASARGFYRGGFYGGGFYGGGFYGGGFYGPGWGWGPYWGPYGYSTGYFYGPNTGQIKFDTKVKDAQVFIDGGYAGTTHENKTLHLRPGTYNVEIREAGRTQYAQKIYIAPGKTVHVRPEL